MRSLVPPSRALAAATLGATFLLVGCASNSGNGTPTGALSGSGSSDGIGSASGTASGAADPTTGSTSSPGGSGATSSSGGTAGSASGSTGSASGSAALGSATGSSSGSGAGGSGSSGSGGIASGSGAGSGGSGATGGSAGDAGSPVTWTEVYSTIISGKCAACHATGKTGVTKGRLDLTTQAASYMNLVGVAATGTSCANTKQTRVIAGDSTNSLLYNKVYSARPVCGGRMPDDNPPLDAGSIGAIKAWIDQGALDN